MTGIYSFNGQQVSYMARLNEDTSLDGGFLAAQADGTISVVALQTNECILIGGSFDTVGGKSHQYIARLDSSGLLDPSFAGPGFMNGAVSAIAPQADGKIFISGGFSSINGYSEVGLARLNSDGTLDTTFRPPLSGTYATYLAIENDQKILMLTNGVLAQLDSDGTGDATFTPVAVSFSPISTIAFQPDGKFLIGGSFTQVDGTNISGIARFLGNGPNQPQSQSLTANLYLGVLLSGTPGENYRVEFVTNLHTASIWTPLTNVTLQSSPALIVDPTLPHGSRFYRAVALP